MNTFIKNMNELFLIQTLNILQIIDQFFLQFIADINLKRTIDFDILQQQFLGNIRNIIMSVVFFRVIHNNRSRDYLWQVQHFQLVHLVLIHIVIIHGKQFLHQLLVLRKLNDTQRSLQTKLGQQMRHKRSPTMLILQYSHQQRQCLCRRLLRCHIHHYIHRFIFILQRLQFRLLIGTIFRTLTLSSSCFSASFPNHTTIA
mmetsp:Transcript_47628/g.79039  ORF Transcript_47628/g.79039 Transcript_47628/m.79039 type:complete len:200 (-) Transcript_47628:786-1385(-)